MPTLNTEELLGQAFGTSNSEEVQQAQQAAGNANQKVSKAVGVNISVVSLTKQQVEGSTLFLGSAFSIDVGFLEPYNYAKGLPPQNGESLKSQVFHLSIQRQHEEFSLMKQIADDMLASGKRELTLKWEEVDAKLYPFTTATWKNSGLNWHFVNRNVAKPGGEKLSSAAVADVLAQLL